MLKLEQSLYGILEKKCYTLKVGVYIAIIN